MEDAAAVPDILPEGGWGWVVCFTSMVANGIVNATIGTFGLVYFYLVREFTRDDPDKAFRTSWVGSVAIGLTFLMCPLAGVAADRFGLRQVSVAGGLLAFIGMLASAFVQNLLLLYLTYGVCVGVGFAFPYTMSVVILGHYFKKRLGFVNGIATFGSSAFSLTYSLTIPALVSSVGLKYTLVFLSGVHFLLIPCALTWKPRLFESREKSCERGELEARTLENVGDVKHVEQQIPQTDVIEAETHVITAERSDASMTAVNESNISKGPLKLGGPFLVKCSMTENTDNAGKLCNSKTTSAKERKLTCCAPFVPKYSKTECSNNAEESCNSETTSTKEQTLQCGAPSVSKRSKSEKAGKVDKLCHSCTESARMAQICHTDDDTTRNFSDSSVSVKNNSADEDFSSVTSPLIPQSFAGSNRGKEEAAGTAEEEKECDNLQRNGHKLCADIEANNLSPKDEEYNSKADTEGDNLFVNIEEATLETRSEEDKQKKCTRGTNMCAHVEADNLRSPNTGYTSTMPAESSHSLNLSQQRALSDTRFPTGNRVSESVLSCERAGSEEDNLNIEGENLLQATDDSEKQGNHAKNSNKCDSSFVNLRIWKKRGYAAWTIGTAVAYLGFLVPFFHLVRHSNDLFPDSNGSLLPLCWAITIGASRLLVGPIADTKIVSSVRLQQTALLGLGITTICIPAAKTFGGLVAIALVLGVGEGVFFLLNGPIVYRLVGQKDATQALGFFLGMIGVPITVGPPLAGLMYDHLGSYTLAFHVAGIAPIVGAAIMMAIPQRRTCPKPCHSASTF